MFDEKYTKSHYKKIESAEDALIICIASALCSGTSCVECARRMYGKGDCHIEKRAAEKWLEENGYDGPKKQQFVYERLFAKQPIEETPAIRKGTCSECGNSEMHASGIRWCKKFSNFVHEDGYCYRFAPSDKMEKEGAK